MKIMTRKEALTIGAKRYFTGKPCLRYHMAWRNVSDGNCVTCKRLLNSARDKANPEAHNARRDRYRAAHPEQARAYSVAWRKANPEKNRACRNKERAAKLHRTPPWADLEAIQAFYVKCPAGYHVDHEVPLQGELISGLHVLENLQYLTIAENLSKGNRIDLAAPLS